LNLVHLSILFLCSGFAGLLFAFMCGINAGTYRDIGEPVEAERATRLGSWSAWIGLALGAVGAVFCGLWALGVGR
jgi:hypothetical protein